MNRRNRQISVGLSVGSSLLLIIFFLFFWLKGEYLKEKEILQNRIDHLMISSIGEIHDSLFVAVFLNRENNTLGHNAAQMIDSAHILYRTLHSDSFHTSPANDFTSLRGTGKQEIQIVQSDQDGNIKKTKKSLSFVIQNDSSRQIFPDSVFWKHQQNSVENIQRKFDISYASMGIPLSYYYTEKPPADKWYNLISHPYQDLFGNDATYVVIREVRPYLTWNLLPRIIFSFFVFGSLCLAFYLIHRNWVAQRKMNLIKSSLISNMTHELKTPIATVQAALDALDIFDHKDDRVKRNEYIDLSKKELGRLDLLVDHVLELSLFEDHLPDLNLQVINFKILFDKVIQAWKIPFDHSQANIEIIIEGDEFQIKGDQVHLSNLLYNLIDNAVKYSPGVPEIRFHLEEKSDHIQFTIQDNGIGIDEKYQTLVFDKFFRVPEGNIHNIKGHGLGLSYVKDVIQKHQGSIRLKSKPSKGTIITIQLPGYGKAG